MFVLYTQQQQQKKLSFTELKRAAPLPCLYVCMYVCVYTLHHELSEFTDDKFASLYDWPYAIMNQDNLELVGSHSRCFRPLMI